MDHLKEISKPFKCPTSSGIHMIVGRSDFLLNTRHHERKRREENLHYACMGTSIMDILALFVDFGNIKFSQKPLLLCLYLPMSIDLMCMTL